MPAGSSAAFAPRSAAAKVGNLAVIPGAVVAADGAAVGDGPPRAEASASLTASSYPSPLLELLAAAGGGDHVKKGAGSHPGYTRARL